MTVLYEGLLASRGGVTWALLALRRVRGGYLQVGLSWNLGRFLPLLAFKYRLLALASLRLAWSSFHRHNKGLFIYHVTQFGGLEGPRKTPPCSIVIN